MFRPLTLVLARVAISTPQGRTPRSPTGLQGRSLSCTRAPPTTMMPMLANSYPVMTKPNQTSFKISCDCIHSPLVLDPSPHMNSPVCRMLGESNTRDGRCPDELKVMACTIALSSSLSMIAVVRAQCLIGDRQTVLCIRAIARGLTTGFTSVMVETFVNAHQRCRDLPGAHGRPRLCRGAQPQPASTRCNGLFGRRRRIVGRDPFGWTMRLGWCLGI